MKKRINKIIIQMKGTDLIRQWRQNIDSGLGLRL